MCSVINVLTSPLTVCNRPCWRLGNETRVPENPGNPPIFKPVNPGLWVLKHPGLTGLVLGVKWQFSSPAVCAAAFFSSSTLIGSQFPLRLYEAERAFSAAGILCTKICSRRHLIPCASYAAIIARASNLQHWQTLKKFALKCEYM